METAGRVAHSDTTVLILGESGVGKTRLARHIHEHSTRRNAPFITVSCGSIPENLLESELFGVEKGAYTGAVKTREGRFQLAGTGTIFLDEIGELPPGLQVKLLRVIQEKIIEPLGGEKEIHVDVRLIAATNRNLEEDVKTGRFREDLYFRLNVIPLIMPPLRDRKEDILPLARYFLSKLKDRDGIHYTFADSDVTSKLLAYSWPGNIRELENCMERMAVLSKDGMIRSADFPHRLIKEMSLPENQSGRRNVFSTGSVKPNPDVLPDSEHITSEINAPVDSEFITLNDLEKKHIESALKKSKGSLAKTAQLLGIHRNTLSRKISEYRLKSDYSEQ
jgi:transcriptional regulator with GAF, ATPase, and Fis domain